MASTPPSPALAPPPPPGGSPPPVPKHSEEGIPFRIDMELPKQAWPSSQYKIYKSVSKFCTVSGIGATILLFAKIISLKIAGPIWIACLIITALNRIYGEVFLDFLHNEDKNEEIRSEVSMALAFAIADQNSRVIEDAIVVNDEIAITKTAIRKKELNEKGETVVRSMALNTGESLRVADLIEKAKCQYEIQKRHEDTVAIITGVESLLNKSLDNTSLKLKEFKTDNPGNIEDKGKQVCHTSHHES